jgi:hypothetical protein
MPKSALTKQKRFKNKRANLQTEMSRQILLAGMPSAETKPLGGLSRSSKGQKTVNIAGGFKNRTLL